DLRNQILSMRPVLRSLWLAIHLAIGLCSCAFFECVAQEPSPEQLAFFENEIRPTLAQHCFPCHGPEKQKADLRLDSLPGILQGGESGPAVVPGDSKNSLMAAAIRYESLQMPPTGKLPQHKINAILQWIDAKTPVPADFAKSDTSDPENSNHPDAKHRKSPEISPQDRDHWAFKPITNPPLPERSLPERSSRSSPHPIDQWIEHRLEKELIDPLPSAPTQMLIRRVFYTLTGLPPSFDEIKTWTARLGDPAQGRIDQQAYQQLIDELLDRPTYAEHWARHWLDVVRFAQSNGYERDGYKPHAWRYRDYVIEAFAQDKPYDRFILEQLAGDELPDTNPQSRVATGFFRLGVWDDEPDDKRQAEFDDLDDSIVSIGSAFLGLSIGCARCHEHKFDPIPQEDYYRLLACIRNVQRYANPENHIDNASSFPLASNEEIRKRTTEHLQRKSTDSQGASPMPPDPSLGIPSWALAVREAPNPPPQTHLLVRGNASTPGVAIEPGFLSVLSHSAASLDPSTAFKASESPLNDLFPTSGRRLALARWIAHPGHPLTARVLVNRLWHYHFGRGIVATTADFGIAGSPPTHPELLDHLASVLIENHWSIKHLHRYILTSEAYQRASHLDLQNPSHAQANTKDPGNKLLWRQNLRRLEAEAIRDSMLAASGELNLQTFGREMFPRLSAEVLAGQSKPGLGWETSSAKDQLRRSIYAIVKRSVRDPLLESFDYSNTTSPLTERPETTVAPQSLMLLNSRFTAERAQAMAKRAESLATTLQEKIQLAYRWSLQRDPSIEELQKSSAWIERISKDYLPLADQIHFRPDVPVSLYSGYRQQLAPSDFLIGPEHGSGDPWDYFPGAWGGGYEGIDVVEKSFGPHAILKSQEFHNGQLSCSMRISRTTELATVLLRAKPDGNRFQGIALRIDPANESLALENLDGAARTQARVHCKVPFDRWFPLRFRVEGNKAQVWIGEGQQAQATLELDFIESENSTEANSKGSLGIACWGGTFSLDQAKLEVLDQDDPQTGKPLAIAHAHGKHQAQRALDGWSSYAGQWNLQSDGSLRVNAEQGPKFIWDEQPFRQGRVSVEMNFNSRQANIGGLILHVSEPKIGADNWLGYEVSFNMTKKTILFGEHRNNWKPIAEVPVDIQPDRWHRLSAEIVDLPENKTQIKIFLDQSSKPVLEHTLESRLPGDQLGLRTWGSEISYRNLVVQTGSQEYRPKWSQPFDIANQDDASSRLLAENQSDELQKKAWAD
ncbi:MAG: hypothetical protein RLZZ396_2840, partial [Planctomycetota bacterium]